MSAVRFSGGMLEGERGEGGESVSVTCCRIFLFQILCENTLYLLASSLLLFSCHVVILLTQRTVNWPTQLAGREIRGIALRVRRDGATIPDPLSADPYSTGSQCSGLTCSFSPYNMWWEAHVPRHCKSLPSCCHVRVELISNGGWGFRGQ